MTIRFSRSFYCKSGRKTLINFETANRFCLFVYIQQKVFQSGNYHLLEERKLTKVFKVIPILAAVLLSACGGGGGGSDDTDAVPVGVSITSANASDATAYAYSIIEDLGSQSSVTAALATGVSVDTGNTGLVAASLKQLYKGLDAQPLSSLAVGATVSQSAACTGGGTISVTVTTAAADRISNGDSMSITANNCVEDGITLNGKIDYGFSNLSGTIGSATAWGAKLTLKFTGFSIRDSSLTLRTDGDMALELNQASATDITTTVTGTSLEMKLTKSDGTAINRKLTNYNLNEVLRSSSYSFSSNFTVSGSDPRIGNIYFTVQTLAPFTSPSAYYYPSSGAVKVTAADKSSVKLTAIDSTNVRIELDKDGDNLIDETINSTWIAIDNAV